MEKAENNNIYQGEDHETKSYRIKSIDFVKGFAICLIILAHSAGVWKKEYLDPLYTLIYRSLDVCGPPLFIFLSSLSVAFTVRRKMGKLHEKTIRNTIFIRGLSIIALGTAYNLLSIGYFDALSENIDVPFPLNLWGWNILMFIGFSQIFTYYILKINRGARTLIGIAIIIATYWIIPNITSPSYLVNPVVYIINFIIISPAPHNPIIPYITIYFFASTFGEILMEVDYLESIKAKLHAFSIFMRNGIFFLLAGILLSFIDVNPYVMQQGFNFPLFVMRGHPSNILYSIGIALILIGGFYYLIDIKGVNTQIIKMFIYYGQISLSLFLIHYIWLPLYIGLLDIWNIWFFYIGYIGFLGFLMFFWNHQFEGKYSLEWIMGRTKTREYKKGAITKIKINGNKIRFLKI